MRIDPSIIVGFVAAFFTLSSASAFADYLLPRSEFGKLPKTQTQSLASAERLINERASFEPAVEYTGTLRRVSDAVGIIDILYQAGNSTCTAFLIADDLLLTNWHCVPGDGGYGSVEAIEFTPNFLGSARILDRVKFSVDPSPVEHGGGVDRSKSVSWPRKAQSSPA